MAAGKVEGGAGAREGMKRVGMSLERGEKGQWASNFSLSDVLKWNRSYVKQAALQI